MCVSFSPFRLLSPGGRVDAAGFLSTGLFADAAVVASDGTLRAHRQINAHQYFFFLPTPISHMYIHIA